MTSIRFVNGKCQLKMYLLVFYIYSIFCRDLLVMCLYWIENGSLLTVKRTAMQFKKLWITDCFNMKHDWYSMKQCVSEAVHDRSIDQL